MILPDTDVDRALAVGERVRAAVAALAVPHADNPGGVVSISVGVAAGAPTGSTATELLAAADAALYEAKGAGRNRVHLSARPAAWS